MSESEKPGLAEVIIAVALGASAGALSYFLDKKSAQQGNRPFDENSLPGYVGAGAAFGAVIGGINVAGERNRQEKLQGWHEDHPRLSKTLGEIEKNPRGREALKQYAQLTGLGD